MSRWTRRTTGGRVVFTSPGDQNELATCFPAVAAKLIKLFCSGQTKPEAGLFNIAHLTVGADEKLPPLKTQWLLRPIDTVKRARRVLTKVMLAHFLELEEIVTQTRDGWWVCFALKTEDGELVSPVFSDPVMLARFAQVMEAKGYFNRIASWQKQRNAPSPSSSPSPSS